LVRWTASQLTGATMNKLITTTAVAFLATVGSAMAADLAVKAPAPPEPIYWNDWYIGLNLGYSWGNQDSTATAGGLLFPGPGGLGTIDSPDVKGVLGGLQLGRNWRVSPIWVFGLEGDLEMSGEDASDGGIGTASSVFVPFNPNPGTIGSNPGCRLGPGAPAGCTLITTGSEANSWKLQWLSTLRARLGVTPDPTLLVYATGGLAIGGTQFSTAQGAGTQTLISNFSGAVLSATAVAGAGAFSETQTRVGFAVGGGVEKMLSREWSIRAEYLYVDLGSSTFLSGTGFDTNIRLRDNIVRGAVNYHFN
jgi:outer membrane immunogenic protein